MNILELNFERTWRGGERQTIYNIQGFVDAGLDVTLLCRKGFPLEVKAIAQGIKVVSFDNISGVIAYLIFSGRKYNILHAQTSHILTYCVFTKLFHGAKVVFTRRVDFVPRGKMTKLKYDLTDRVVAISIAVKDILERFGAWDVAVISDAVVPWRADAARGAKLRAELNLKPATRIIGTVAALVPHKDPMNMVEAINVLSATRNDFVFLHFGNGELENEVRDKIKEYGLEGVYKLMGFHENVEDFISFFDVFTMSSQEEGLGSSVLDAFLDKVPVAATDAGGLTDLLADGRGIMCRKRSPQHLAESIDLLLNQPALGKEIAERAYRYALNEHSVAAITGMYLEVFKSL